MGIGYAPNKELYTEHFLKPLRSAFSERDLQVDLEPTIIMTMEIMCTGHMEDDNHDYDGDNVYRLTWSLVRVDSEPTIIMMKEIMCSAIIVYRLYEGR